MPSGLPRGVFPPFGDRNLISVLKDRFHVSRSWTASYVDFELTLLPLDKPGYKLIILFTLNLQPLRGVEFKE